ncbi:50S ribosomal protein L1 [Labeo rohita]|uniref:50S ribosomal protein L1 n=1 Tax=Labeo rohita TaxID=84645 RepID=A0ABQ8LJX2_LABRO|nr:50S ribosomal protein L1 [Labeo rohita]
MSGQEKSLVKSGESGPRFTLCVPPCKRYITSGDTHSMCVVCLGAEHTVSALEGADCPHCELLPLRTLRSRKALFEEGAFTSVPQGAGMPRRSGSTARSEGSEARTAVTSPQGAGSSLHISSSEEGDLLSTTEEVSPQSVQYEELLEVVTRAVAKLNIDWPAEEKAAPSPRRSLPFFPDLHKEIARSWERPYSARLFVPASDYYGNVAGLDERAYKVMPRVEQTLASYLSPGAASSLKAPSLPSKLLRTTSSLVGKGYSAAGQAGACLHTMSLLQTCQADLLQGLSEGDKVDLEELCRTADLALRATKETARAVGRSMAAMVAAERHLCSAMQYQEARKQAAAFQRYLPRRSLASAAAGREQPQPKCQQDPANCPVGTVLEFLQARFSTGLAHSTLKVYVAAISAYHAPLGGIPVGRNPLVVRFLRGVLKLRPPTRPRVPTWDLAVVLEALCRPPFEPIEEILIRFFTIKTVLLLALTSLKQVGDLQALSVAPSHLEFSPGIIKAFLYPRPGYVPKVPTNTPQPVVLQAFCPPPFREPDQQKLNCMCPVRALDAYVHRAALWHKSEQLFVCYGPPKKGYPASKETLSRWILDAISTAYESFDLPSPLGVMAHSTRAIGASKAFSTAGIWKSGGVGISFPKRLRAQLEFLKGNVPVTYVTLVPRGNETLRLGPSFRHPCRALASSTKLTPAGFAQRGSAKGVPKASPDAASRSLGEPRLHT